MENNGENKVKFLLGHIGIDVDISKTEYYQQQQETDIPITECKLIGGKIYNGDKFLIVETNLKKHNGGILALSPDIVVGLFTPLEKITDEQAIEVAKLHFEIFRHSNSEFKVSRNYREGVKVFIWSGGKFQTALGITEYNQGISSVDFLRDNEFALPYMGLSVKKQIEYEWIKLKK